LVFLTIRILDQSGERPIERAAFRLSTEVYLVEARIWDESGEKPKQYLDVR